MTRELLTVCTATMGDSCGHINRIMLDLRAFTKLPFAQIVCDDGTLDDDQHQRQENICRIHGASWFENPGPYGISHNFNHMLEQVKTPWAYLIEDGLRPGYGWLEAAVEAIEKIGTKTWLGHKVGWIGFPSIEDWQLALAGALPGAAPWRDYLGRTNDETYSAFWGDANHPNWNDGRWSWPRVYKAMRDTIIREKDNPWPAGFESFRELIEQLTGINQLPAHSDEFPTSSGSLFWPVSRTAFCSWFAGAFALVNMEAWRTLGRFRDGCTFFEGHFGLRLAKAKWLSLSLSGPPFLHFHSMGFSAAELGKKPRDHRPCDGDTPADVLFADFGCNGPGHSDVFRKIVLGNFAPDYQNRINQELAQVQLSIPEGWESETTGHQ